MRFKAKRSGSVVADVEAAEAGLLSAMAADLSALLSLDQDEPPGEQDPLVALVGLTSGPALPPADPALGRLFPDAYADDSEAASEFRRYTEQDLRSGKQAGAGVVLATLAPLVERGGRLVLDRDEVDAWLGTLNDLRLVLATRLEVTEETDLDPADDQPGAAALQVYGWLGWLQESLLRCVSPRSPGSR